MNSALKNFVHVANGAPDPHRFDGVSAAARKVRVKGDVTRHKGHNREHAWMLWSKIQRGHITAPETITALRAEYGEMFKEFEHATYKLVADIDKAGTQVA
jgi:hypothetical protein